MRKSVYIFSVLFAFAPVFAKCQCAFTVKDKNARKDQYSMSSQTAIDKSKKAMAEQGNEFDKKKYQATVKNNKAVKTKVQPRYSSR